MKKVLLFGMLLTATLSYSQLEVEETTDSKEVIWRTMAGMSLYAFYAEEDTSYVIYYKNAEYTSITVIEYLAFDDSEQLSQFFNLCEISINEKKEFRTTKYRLRKFGKSAVVYPDDGFFYMSLKNINKLKGILSEKGHNLPEPETVE